MRSALRVFRQIKKAWLELLAAFICLSIFAYISYRLPLLLKDLIDLSLIPSLEGAAAPLPAISFLRPAAGLLIGLFVCGTASEIILPYAKNKITRLLRNELFAKLFTLPLKTFDELSGGDLITRLTTDAAMVAEGLFSTTLVQLPRNLFVAGSSLFGLYHLMGPKSLFFTVFILLFYQLGKRYSRAVTPMISKLKKNISSIAHRASETLRIHEILKLNRAIDSELQRFDQENASFVKQFVSYAKTDWSYFMAIFGLNRIVPRLGIALLAYLAIGGAPFTVGAIVAVSDYLMAYLIALDNFVDVLPRILDSMTSAERIHEILDLPDEPQGGEPFSPSLGPIVFDEVDFSYLPEKPILKHLSFSVAPGEKVALVGPTGSGKSTILQVLLGFRPLQSGHIYLGGKDLSTLRLTDLRQSFAVVQQDPALFEGTLYENLSLGKSEISKEQAQAALNTVLGLDNEALKDAVEITRIQEKLVDLKSQIESRGRNLSAGEQQLVAFARALAHDPKILILDEATAAVDPATERLLNHAVHRLQKGRTTLIVAHRLSTIQQCDRILVLNEGRLEASGTHEELLQTDGTYRRFVLDSGDQGKAALQS
ncbi:MAG: ABC transporter ATP-binding protein [Eubacteriales bacterium]|nr:ABC transporter ATP-binding protein [Eubacteriales bacterium]